MSSSDDGLTPEEPNDFDVPDASVELTADACLVVVSGTAAGRNFALLGNETVIGRSSSAQIRLTDRSISTAHAKLVRDGARHMLVDLGSTNGTSLNGRRLQPNRPTLLAVGDNIMLAETVLAYMPSQGRNPEEQTQYLSRILPQINQGGGGSNALATVSPDLAPSMQVLAQLLQSAAPAAPEPPKPTLEEQIQKIRAILTMVARNWIPLFASAALCALIGNASVFMKPPLSEAAFTIRIAPPPVKETDRNDPESMQFFSAAEQDFVSPALMKKTLVKLGNPFPSPWQITQGIRSLKLDQTAYMTYTGTYKSPDPRYSVRFLEKHAEAFVETEIEKSIHVVMAEVDFLGTRLKERESELAKTEGTLKDFKSKHLEGLPEFSSGHVTSREALLQRRAEVAAQASRARLQFGEAQKQLAHEAPILGKKIASAQPFEQALGDVERKIAEAHAKGLANEHPELQSLNKQRQDLKRLADSARTSDATALEASANPALLDLQRRVGDSGVAAKGAAAELGEINAEIERLDTILKTSPDIEARYAQLTRAYSTNRELYTQLFTQLKEAQLKLDLERTSARARYEVLTPPSSDGIPLRKALLQRTMMGLGAGLLIGALIAAVLELRKFLRRRAVPTIAVTSNTTSVSTSLAKRS